MSNNEQQKFKQWLDQIVEELVLATCYFKVWVQLWPSTEKIAHVENLYRNFFLTTRTALNNQFLLQLSKILDHHRSSINIFKLTEMLEKQPDLITEKSLDINKLGTKLNEMQEVFKRLKTLRDKKLAHVDEQFHTNASLRKSLHIYFIEAKALLSNLAEIVTDISVAHNGVVPVFDTLGIGDTSELLKTLVLLNKKDTVSIR